MYSITGIFRTENGLLPGYGIAPASPGVYELEKELIIISEDKLYTVTRAEVLAPRSGVLLVTRKGCYPVAEDTYQGQAVYSIDNAPLCVVEPRKTIDDEFVKKCAFYAGYSLAGLTWQHTNMRIQELTVTEIRARPISMKEYFAGRRYILDFTALTRKQVYSWFYHTCVVLHRIGALYTPKWDISVHIKLARIWWRDMFLAILHHLNADFSLKLVKHGQYDLTIGRKELRRCMARLLTVKFERVMDDFALADSVVMKTEVILDKSGEVSLIDDEDEPDKVQKTLLQSKPVDFTNMLISFPQIRDQIEVNSLIF